MIKGVSLYQDFTKCGTFSGIGFVDATEITLNVNYLWPLIELNELT